MRSGKTVYYLVIFFVVAGIFGILFGPRQKDLEKIRKQHNMVPVVAASDRPANEKTGGFMYLKDEPHLLYVEIVDMKWQWFRIHYTAEYIQYSEKDANGNILYYAYDPDTGETVIADVGTMASSALDDKVLDEAESISVNNTNRDETPKRLLNQTYINEGEGFSFMYPEGWIVEEGSSDLLVRVSAPDESVPAGAQLKITKTYAIDAFFSASISEWEQILPMVLKDDIVDIRVLSLDDISLNGYSAKKLIYTIAWDGESARQILYFYLRNSEMYMVACASNEDLWHKYEPVFGEIMDSYVITDVSLDKEANISDSCFTEEIPFGYEGEETYTDYIEWGGIYDDGWMDTTLTFTLYSDGTEDPECGYMTICFRGMENSGRLYYLGGNGFRWEGEGYESSFSKTYYIYAVNNNGMYQLEIYNSDGTYEVTFTLYEQYVS